MASFYKHIPLHRQNNRPTVIFLHGWLGDTTDFSPLYEELSQNYSYLGINWMNWCYEAYQELRFDLVINLLHDLIINSTSKPVHLLGYSMGGRVALVLKKHFPHLIDKLILLSAHHGRHQMHEFNSHQEWRQQLLEMPLDAFLQKWYQQPLFCTLKDYPELFKNLLQKRSLQNPKMLLSALDNLTTTHQRDCFDLVNHNPKCLILIGEKDLKYRQLYTTIFEETFLTRSNLTHVAIIEGTSHALHIERPDLCMKHIIQFLNGDPHELI